MLTLGNYINPENAKVIGLIPDIATEEVRFVGNTAVVQAKMALISKKVRATEYLAKVIRYHELELKRASRHYLCQNFN